MVSVQVGGFLSTLSLRRATDTGGNDNGNAKISIHALLAESDPPGPEMRQPRDNFYPRSPCGERLKRICFYTKIPKFLSTLSLRRATILTEINKMATGQISIHALLAESDKMDGTDDITAILFLSTLSLRRATNHQGAFRHGSGKFLSTLSLRRATLASILCTSKYIYFYPRSPCGERPITCCPHMQHVVISIHALLAESDCSRLLQLSRPPAFLSTLSLRRATIGAITYVVMTPDFYPRSPCGERLMTYKCLTVYRRFLSTLSLRRATVTVLGIQHRVGISIHALLAESDPHNTGNNCIDCCISIHALLAESDLTRYRIKAK